MLVVVIRARFQLTVIILYESVIVTIVLYTAFLFVCFNYTTTLGNGKFYAENGYFCRCFKRPLTITLVIDLSY